MMNFDNELNEKKVDSFVFELQLSEQVACCFTSCNFLTEDRQSQFKTGDVFVLLIQTSCNMARRFSKNIHRKVNPPFY